MIKRFAIFSAALLLSGLAALAQSTMSDQEVLDYIRRGTAEGKSQNEMLQELALKGVDRAQANRVRALYEQQQEAGAADAAATAAAPRTHTVADETPIAATSEQSIIPEESFTVFGREIFRGGDLNFAPSENLATPKNYRLGPGDEVIIDIFGANQNTIRGYISPEGSINLDILGPVYLSGMTIDEANSYLKRKLAAIYGGLNRHDGTDIRLSLGQIRTIQINVLGEVAYPGTYLLSSFATAFHALYKAGGIVDPGSLRDIRVVRGGKTVASLDVYQFLMNGSLENDIRLDEGDVILVVPYKTMVKTSGAVKRPMYFELKDGETIADVLYYAGGFANGALTDNITLTRQTGRAYEVRTVDQDDYSYFKLADGDELQIGVLQSRFENKLTVFGSVFQPGVYELGEEIHTVRQLVAKAGGLMPEAFLGRAVIHREHEDRTMEVISLNLGNVLDGTDADITLRNNDELYVASQFDLQDRGDMTITGFVTNPGTFPFAENTTVEDLIILAGGLRDGASLSRVDVTRRFKDEYGVVAGNEVAQLYSFPIKNGLIDDGDKGFILEPYDEVIVHQSPSYTTQRHVVVSGEVNFPGTFTLTGRTDRLSDLVAKAGGVTPFAYLKGARLVRQMNDVERRQTSDIVKTLLFNEDTTSANMVETGAYAIAIELEKALQNPGDDNYDVVLREGDELSIPVLSNTVRVSGAVKVPNVLSYNASNNAKDYIDLCGGYAHRAKRYRSYIVNVNGSSQKLRPFSKVEPGAEIIIATKERKNHEFNWTNLATVGSMIASLGTMASYLIVAEKR